MQKKYTDITIQISVKLAINGDDVIFVGACTKQKKIFIIIISSFMCGKYHFQASL